MRKVILLFLLIPSFGYSQHKLTSIYLEANWSKYNKFDETAFDATASFLPFGKDESGTKAGIAIGYFKLPDLKAGIPVSLRASISPNKFIGNFNVGYLFFDNTAKFGTQTIGLSGGLFYKFGIGYALSTEGFSPYFIANFSGVKFKVNGGSGDSFTHGISGGIGFRF